jgi:hypothetical protein
MATLRRRRFLAVAAGATVSSVPRVGRAATGPWYTRCHRWGQTTASGPQDSFDLAFWRDQWKRSALDGVLVETSDQASDKDTFGRVTEAAHNDGFIVLAAIDSTSVSGDVLKSNPEWFARTGRGEPIPWDEGFAPCVNGPYRQTQLFGVFRELIDKAHPEGFAERGWSGLGRTTICYCENCAKLFRDSTGQALPLAVAWDDPIYRDWIRWNYARRLQVWEQSNQETKRIGGPDCLWIGMNAASRALQSAAFRDSHAIAQRTPVLLVDNQSRYEGGSFRQNAVEGRYLNGLPGSDKIVVETMAMYQQGRPFRRSGNPATEAHLWMLSGIAGGMQPCFRHVANRSDDRRQYEIAPPVFQWHKKNERYLANRTRIATIGLVWSQSSADFYGRNSIGMLAELPYQGMAHAIGTTNIPFVPIHIEDIERNAAGVTVLVLPNIGGMSDGECAAVRRFVERGGTLIATGVTSLYNQDGEPRSDFGLAPVLGAHIRGKVPDRMYFVTIQGSGSTGAASGRSGPGPGSLYVPGPYGGPAIAHTYLRLLPELAAKTHGPHHKGEPSAAGQRHAVLDGFQNTDILPFGGFLAELQVDSDRTMPCTFVPAFPQSPTDEIWMREPRTNIPALILGKYGKGNVAFLPADLDRRYGMDPIPDHGMLLRNLVRWAAGDRVPVSVEGPARVGTYLYRQENRLILHLVNETGADNQRALLDEPYSVGPLKIKVALPPGVKGRSVRLMVSESPVRHQRSHNVEFEIAQIRQHELVVIE